jgi:hypothetical protein
MRRGSGRRVFSVLATGASVGVLLGCGSNGKGASSPFTVSDSEVRAECLFGTYLPEEVGQRAAERPPPREWRKIEDAPGALEADRAAVVLTIRPKHSEERIVLTSVRLEVNQHRLRPLGTALYRPCDRELRGPAIEADLSGSGRVAATSAALGGIIGPGVHLPHGARPIEFPWTVTLDRPLRIYLIAHSKSCYCTWKASIPWHSGSSKGTIDVDNGGRGYTMTDTIGIVWNRPGPDGRWAQVPPPRWTGVR